MAKHEIIALTISTIAVTISIATAAYSGFLSKRLSSSDYRATQQVKSDTARLLATLRSLMYKGALSRTESQDFDISPEKAVIAEFLTSQTGFAYRSLVYEKHSKAEAEGRKEEPWRLFFLYLAELSNSDDAYSAACRAADVELLFDQLTENDISKIAEFNSDLVKAIANNPKSRDGDPVIKAIVESQRERSELNSSETVAAKLKYLKNLGIDDPNIDRFLAEISGNVSAMETALKAGADPHITGGALLNKYADELKDYSE